ncbi:MAG: hypothetical protein SGI91_23975 [Alphaproteobacteria bacterium]|nr:hypothetical protein [Alphaproteobacteria bacterium]
MNRGVQVWAVSLVLTLVGMVLTVGVWALAVAYGAPPLIAIALAFGVAVLLGALVGVLMRWLTD